MAASMGSYLVWQLLAHWASILLGSHRPPPPALKPHANILRGRGKFLRVNTQVEKIKGGTQHPNGPMRCSCGQPLLSMLLRSIASQDYRTTIILYLSSPIYNSVSLFLFTHIFVCPSWFVYDLSICTKKPYPDAEAQPRHAGMKLSSKEKQKHV